MDFLEMAMYSTRKHVFPDEVIISMGHFLFFYNISNTTAIHASTLLE
jgi:hypothetical protein